jgi:hypothetical protein
MPEIRRVAALLHEEGHLSATQKGKAVHPEHARGPIRLSLATGPDHPLP